MGPARLALPAHTVLFPLSPTALAPPLSCSVRAEPEWGVLGKRLGKAMAAVAKAVKALPMEVGCLRIDLF